MSFAADSFNGTTGQELSAYSASWSKQTGYTADGIIGNVTATYVMTGSATTAAVYQHSASPASADYSVFVDVKATSLSTSPQFGPAGRMQAGADTYYAITYRPTDGQLRLFKLVAGTGVQLGSSYSFTPVANTVYNIELRMAGNSISAHLDGSAAVISATDSASAITTAGKAGIYLFRMRETGVDDRGRLEEFWANDAAGAAPTLSDLRAINIGATSTQWSIDYTF